MRLLAFIRTYWRELLIDIIGFGGILWVILAIYLNIHS